MKQSKLVYASVALCVVGAAGTAFAQECLDLRDREGNFDQSGWGRPNTVIYAQSVVACDTLLTEVRVRAKHRSGNDIQFNVIVSGTHTRGGGLGQEPDLTDIRYNSGMQKIPVGGEMTEVIVNPNLKVDKDELIWLVFEAFSYSESGVGTMRATQFNAQQDPYLPGEFVYANLSGQRELEDFNNASWGHRSPNKEDLALLVSFGGGSTCSYTLKKSKSKRGCDACPKVGSEYKSQQGCEVKKDCKKKVKTTITCPQGNGKCKLTAKKRKCG